VGKPEGKKIQLERPTHRWEDNIKIFFKETQLRDLEWICVSQGRAIGGLL
jgi:hypothetical protein